MSCITLLAGKAASYDGSTITARNEDVAAFLKGETDRLLAAVLGKATVAMRRSFN